MTTNKLCFSYLIFILLLIKTSYTDKVHLMKTETHDPNWGFSIYKTPGRSRAGWVFNQEAAAFQVCDVSIQAADNWLLSKYIDVSNADYIHIDILYKQLECSDQPDAVSTCENTLSVKYGFSNRPSPPTKPSDSLTSELTSLKHKAPFLKSWDESKFGWLVESTLNVQDQSGFFLAFQDKGSCSMLLAINIYHYVCPKQVLGLAWFPKTAMGTSGAKKRVEAFHCIEHASISSESDKPEAYCQNGVWESNMYLTFLCECDPGYTPNRDNTMCLPCGVAKYKNRRGNMDCKPCPANSISPVEGSSSCRCASNFHRAVNDSLDTPCQAPPPKPILQSTEVQNTDVTIKWDSDPLGEPVGWFTVQCLQCVDKVIKVSGSEQVTLRNLDPVTEYTVQIFSENYLTDGQRNIANYIETKFTTKTPPIVGNLTATQSSDQQTIALQWSIYPKMVTEFEVFVYRNDNLEVIYGTKHTSYELPTTQGGKYVFRVCIQSNDRLCSEDLYVSVIDHQMWTGMNPRNLVLGAAMIMAVILVVLILLLTAVWCYKKSHPLDMGQMSGHPDWSGHNKYTLGALSHMTPMGAPYLEGGAIPYGQSFVDPSFCEEPEKLLFEFSREIFLEQIQFFKESHNDEGVGFKSTPTACGQQVCRATLHGTDNQSCAVLVKSIHDSDSESVRNTCIEAAIMAQFNHPNVQMLHGTVVQSTELMICVEYASQGPLNNLLRENPTHFSLMQLVHVLRGIACGMQYLSELGFVHKVLFSGNVLLTGSSVAKISGFDMRTMLEVEEMNGTKPNIFAALMPWFAPEVLANRSYSSQSDVFSFGVLMWELLSGGQQPFTSSKYSADTLKGGVSGGGHPALPRPLDCPEFLFDMMRHCWLLDPLQRPTFAHLRETLEKLVRNSHMLNEKYNFESVYGSYPLGGKEMHGQYLPIGAYYPASFDNHNYSFNSPAGGKVGSQISPASTIEEWLQSLKLSQYTELFYSRNLVFVKDLVGSNATSHESLELLGIHTSKHRKRMLSNLNEIASSFGPTGRKESAVHIII